MQEKTENILSINQNIIQFIEYIGLNRYKFSKKTGISESVLLNIYKVKNKPSIDILEKILKIYPVLNLTWLVTGKGKMFIEAQDTIDEEDNYKTKVECINCKEKERTIIHLEKNVLLLEKANDNLEKELAECRRQSAHPNDSYKQTGT